MRQRHESAPTTDTSTRRSPVAAPSLTTSLEEAAVAASSEAEDTLKEERESALSRSAQQYQAYKRKVMRNIGIPILWLAADGLLARALNGHWQPPPLLEELIVWPPLLWMCGYFTVSLIKAATISTSEKAIPLTTEGVRQRRTLTAQVAAEATVDSIGPLLEAFALEDRRTSRTALAALPPLLSQLTAENAPDLTASQRTQLNMLLSPSKDLLNRELIPAVALTDSRMIDLRIAILHALPYVGGSDALPIVRGLATGKARTEGEKRIQEAAIACLPLLERAVAAIENNTTLLRASSGRATENLLRPVTEKPDSVPEELLRASCQEPSLKTK